jgi:hypothetical protein
MTARPELGQLWGQLFFPILENRVISSAIECYSVEGPATNFAF